jgi:hypothetical protein
MLVQVPLADAAGPVDAIDGGPGWLAVISGHRAELALVPWGSAPVIGSRSGLSTGPIAGRR